jgi:hypothetical protein
MKEIVFQQQDRMMIFLSSISTRVVSRKPATMGFKTELDRYLGEELLDMHTKNFEVLDW